MILAVEIPAACISAAVVARAELLFYLLLHSGEDSRSIAARATTDGLRGNVFVGSSAALCHSYRRALNRD